MLSKSQLPSEITTERTLIRRTVADDLPQIAAWPAYRGPYGSLEMTGSGLRSANGRYCWETIDEPDRCHCSVILPTSEEIIGLHAFVRIDWAKATVGNMLVYIRADMCDQGYGAETLKPLLKAALSSGFRSIRLDVAATNPRAIRCYKKCGMHIVGEFWREHEGDPIDPADPKWAPLMPDLRREGEKWMVRFHWMKTSVEGNNGAQVLRQGRDTPLPASDSDVPSPAFLSRSSVMISERDCAFRHPQQGQLPRCL